MAPPFDRFIAIDWSARNKPSPAKPSRDAIWLAESRPSGSVATRYFRTREACTRYLTARLRRLVEQNQRVLVGWDFSFGYPKGLAKALRLRDKPAWLSVWKLIDDLLLDDVHNQNNRFTVGAELNRLTRAPGGPFWGAPYSDSGIYLGSKRDFSYPVPTKRVLLAERRLVEKDHPRMQPAWKLAYAGSVGGQSLTGIPRLLRARHHPQLAPHTAIWPFEDITDRPIVHAEIYPSMFPIPKQGIVDREQVIATVRWCRARQRDGTLKNYLAAPLRLPAKLRKRVINHEGWVLGYLRGSIDSAPPQ